MEDHKIAVSKGKYTTTWKIIYELSGKDKKANVKVNKRDGTPLTSETDLLVEWREYFSSLLNSNSQSPSTLPPPVVQDLPILTDPPTREETLSAIRQMKTNKAAGLDYAITAEALQNGGVYTNHTLPNQ